MRQLGGLGVIGVDIGVTHIRRGWWTDSGGTILNVVQQPVPSTKQGVIDFIRDGKRPYGPRRVGVALAGMVENGVLVMGPNTKQLEGVSEIELSSACDVMVCLRNDMRCATTGVIHLRPDLADFVCYNFGSGQAIWRVLDHKIVSTAPEGGHAMLSLDPDAPVCGCGQRGHIEAYLGADYLSAKLRQIAIRCEVDLGENLWQTAENAYLTREAWALYYYHHYLIRPVAAVLSSILAIHNPVTTIVRRGGFGLKRFPAMEAAVREEMKSMVFKSGWENVEIIPTPSENDALLGAAILAAQV